MWTALFFMWAALVGIYFTIMIIMFDGNKNNILYKNGGKCLVKLSYNKS